MRLIIVGLLLFFILPLIASSKLTDGDTLSLRPNSVGQINVEIPDDWGVIKGTTMLTITTDCEEWCDLHERQIITDPFNPVKVPIFLSTEGKSVGQSKSFTIGIQSSSGRREFVYGICVSSQEDINNGQGSPCSVVNNKKNIVSLSIDPKTIYVRPGGNFDYTVNVYSQAVLDVELTLADGKKVDITTDPKQTISRKETLKSFDRIETITVQAKVKGCENTCDISKATATVIPSSTDNLPSANFSLFISPEKTNSDKNKPVFYIVNIKNYGDQKTYNIDMISPDLPTGLSTDFEKKSLVIKDTESVRFSVTPTGDKSLYTFKITVEANGVSKDIDAYITVNEFLNDWSRTKATDNVTDDTKRLFDDWAARNRNTDQASQALSFEDRLRKAQEGGGGSGANGTGGGGGTVKPPKPSQPPSVFGVDLLYIIIPIVVIVVVLLIIFFKKGKTEETEEEKW